MASPIDGDDRRTTAVSLGGAGIIRGNDPGKGINVKTSTRSLRIFGGAGTAAVALLFATSGVADAHVGVSGTSTAAGTSSVLTFSSGHGCDGSPTTEFAIQIPKEFNAATPTQLAGWDARKVMQPLDTPITDSHGNQITERVDQVIYSAKEPLADGLRVAFEVSVRLPENAAGTTLYFPTIQRCVQGQSDWIEIPATGQDADDLESPAPAVPVTAAAGTAGHGTGAATPAAPEPAASAAQTDSSGNALSLVALVAGVAGIILGGAALVRARPRA